MRTAQKKGQALVIVLLSLAVVLTLVLFILSRTITDISVSTTEEEAIRAFSAAEAGVENALIASNLQGSFGDASFSADVTNVAEGAASFNYPADLSSGGTITLWFAQHQDNGSLSSGFTGSSLDVCWGKDDTADNSDTTPAIEMIVFYEDNVPFDGDFSDVRIARATVDPYSGRTSSNAFDSSLSGRNCVIDGATHEFIKTFNLNALTQGNSNGLLFAKVRMFYNSDSDHSVGFEAGSGEVFPSQGIMIDSTGTSGESNRRLEVFQGWGESPSIFDSAVFSDTGLTK